MPKVKLVAPDGGPRSVPVLSEHGIPDLVEHGATIDVPAEVAGEGPRWRRLDGESDPHHPINDPYAAHEYREHAGHPEVYDLGSGLLAQVGIWELVEHKTKDAD